MQPGASAALLTPSSPDPITVGIRTDPRLSMASFKGLPLQVKVNSPLPSDRICRADCERVTQPKDVLKPHDLMGLE